MSAYAELEREAERPKRLRDHTARWEQLEPVASVNGHLERRLRRFCETKGITPEALQMLEPRLRVGVGGKVEIAFAGRGPSGAVTAIKYRHLEGSSHETRAEAPSTWLRPIVAGRPDALVWLVAEGETDACRLLDLAPAGTTVLVLPCGAKTFRREWADEIPRGASVYLCHDADEAGDEGAAKVAQILGTNVTRLRPPIDGADWCDWPGSREEFAELLSQARTENNRPFALPLDEFIAAKSETPPALIGDEIENLLPAFGLLILFAKGGKGKTTLIVDAALHFASGIDWLGFKVERPLRVLFIENEGPREPFRAQARAEAEALAARARRRDLRPDLRLGRVHARRRR